MVSVGDTVQLTERWAGKYAIGQKMVLRAKVKFLSNEGNEIANGCIVEVHSGSNFRYCDLEKIKIIELDREIDLDDKIVFVPESLLEPWNGNTDLILCGLHTIWSSSKSDHYSKWRKEYEIKYGYDPHKYVYK